jgi:hypothetical protein
LVEEIKLREETASKVKSLITYKVDPACEVKNSHVLNDYSCYMQQTDIAYTDKNEQTRFYKMQLLERNDEKKWFLWV